MKGFTVEEAPCWWVACNACGDTHLVYGMHADMEAMTWATEHLADCAGDEPSEAELLRYYHSGGGEDAVARQQIRDAGRPGL